jgi:hypothetical protein
LIDHCCADIQAIQMAMIKHLCSNPESAFQDCSKDPPETFEVVYCCRRKLFWRRLLAPECKCTVLILIPFVLVLYGHQLHICTENKIDGMKGWDPVRSKILIDIIEHENSFNYLGNLITYEKEVNIDNILCNYLKITGIINSAFRPQKTLKQTTVKLFSTLALPSLLYGRDNWTIKAR